MSSLTARDLPRRAPDAPLPTLDDGREPASRRWMRRGIVLAMLVGVLVVYFPLQRLLDGKIIYGGDFGYLHVRRMTFARQMLFKNPGGAELPAWYPRELMGTPFWSNVQNFPFLPTRLLVFALLDPRYTYTFAISIAALLTATFTYLYARRIALDPIASAVAGWTFACCGFFAGRIPAGHMPLLEAMPALPLLLWLIEVCLQSPRDDRRLGWKLLALGLSCGCVMTAGHPQVPVYALFASGLYVLYRAPGRLPPAGMTLAAMIVGVGVASFVLYPMALLIGRSTRILDLAKADNDIAFPYARLKAFLFPWADGWAQSARQNVKVPYHKFDPRYPHIGYFWDTICYIGWAPIVAAALLFVRWLLMTALRRGKRLRELLATPWPFMTLLGVLSLVLALPFWQELMSHIPGTILRSPSRQIYLTSFALAMALGGATCLIQRCIARLERGSPMMIASGVALTLAIALHVFDESRHARNFIYMIEFPVPADPAAEQAIQNYVGDGRVAVDVMQRVARRMDDVGFFDSIMLARPYRVILDLANYAPDTNVQVFDAARLPRRALEFLGVKVVLTSVPRPDLQQINAPGARPMLYKIPNPAPRAQFFPAIMSRYFSVDDIHKLLREPALDLTSGLMLPTTSMPPETPMASPPPPPGFTPGLDYRRPSPDRIEVDARADQDGFVTVAESFDPGWAATVDGRPADVLPADDVFLAVRVTPGAHQLRFVYRTPGAVAGLGMSVISVACLTVLAAGSSRWRRRITVG